MDDDIDYADLERYGGYYPGGAKPPEEEEDEPLKVPVRSFKTPAAPIKRKSDFNVPAKLPEKRAAVVHNHTNGNIVLKKFLPMASAVDPDTLLDGMTMVGASVEPIQERVDTAIIIPYAIKHAAEVLMDAHTQRDIRLSGGALSDMGQLLKCDDEFTTYDPPVIICDSLDTGTCRIYVKEVVPISILLMAMFFKCTYTIEVISGVSSNAKTYEDVQVKAFHDSNAEYAQPFGCREHVELAIQESNIDVDTATRLSQYYMYKLGPLSSETASDPNFIQDHVDRLGKFVTSEKNVLEKRGDGVGSTSARKKY